jgi:hypothetical protein
MYRNPMTHPHIIRVIGMPRSGTAFASQVLAMHPDCIAYHELASYDKDWRNTIANNEADLVADCNTYGFMHEAQIPASVLIYLDRSAEGSCEASIRATGHELTIQQFTNLRRMMEQWALYNNAYVMSEGVIFTLDGMEMLWKTAFGNHVEFPKEKAVELLKLNVQHHNPKIQFSKAGGFEV